MSVISHLLCWFGQTTPGLVKLKELLAVQVKQNTHTHRDTEVDLNTDRQTDRRKPIDICCVRMNPRADKEECCISALNPKGQTVLLLSVSGFETWRPCVQRQLDIVSLISILEYTCGRHGGVKCFAENEKKTKHEKFCTSSFDHDLSTELILNVTC